jgi:hypothetical protein
MPAKKSTSPEAAQNKERKAEIRELEKARKHVIKRFGVEEREMNRQVEITRKAALRAEKAHSSACNKYDRAFAKMHKSKTRELNQIDRRIDIVKGRVGAG